MMNQFKYFEQEGAVYKFKPQYIFKAVIVILLIGVSYVCWQADIKFLVAIFGLLTLMVLMTLFSDKFEIDTNQKEINMKQGVFIQTRKIPFDKIANFEMLTTTTNFIRSSVELNLYYNNDKGKEKVIKIAQGISKKHMQKILNEINEILGNE